MNILSLNGGGYKGLFTALILNEIESRLNEPLIHYIDLIAGTSAGSIIACALSTGIRSCEIVEILLKEGKDIFKKDLAWQISSCFGLTKSKYSNKPIESFLNKIFGEKKFKECFTNTICISYNITTNTPMIFKNYKQPDILIKDVVRASSAAPTFFPTHKINGNMYIDGAVTANNPAIIAYTEGKKWWDKVNIVSIGAMTQYDTYSIKNGGIADWIFPIIKILMSSTSENIDYLMKRNILQEDDIYTYIDYIAEEESISIDDISNKAINKIIESANKIISKNDIELDNIVKNLKKVNLGKV